jgi:hypothetical protein
VVPTWLSTNSWAFSMLWWWIKTPGDHMDSKPNKRLVLICSAVHRRKPGKADAKVIENHQNLVVLMTRCEWIIPWIPRGFHEEYHILNRWLRPVSHGEAPMETGRPRFFTGKGLEMPQAWHSSNIFFFIYFMCMVSIIFYRYFLLSFRFIVWVKFVNYPR